MNAVASLGSSYVGCVVGGRYEIVEPLRDGTIGRVYRGNDLPNGVGVAVQILDADVTVEAGAAARFHRDVGAARAIRHPHVLALLDSGQTDTGLLFVVGELLVGRTLAELLRDDGPLAPARAAGLLAQGLRGLEAAHGAGLVHGDFCLDRLLVERHGSEERVKLLDLGLARVRARPEISALTSGAAFAHLPPEVAAGETLDARADVYSAGATLYHMLTGSPPFFEAATAALRRGQRQPPEPPRLRRPDLDLPIALETVCLRALSTPPAERFEGAAVMRDALLEASGGVRITPAAGVPARRGSPALRRAPLVGREAELARIEAALEPVLVVGPPGSGRSRLCEELCARIGRPSLVINADPSGAQQTLEPIRIAVAESLGVSTAPSLHELDSAVLPAQRLGLAELFGLLPPPGPLEREARRRELAVAATIVLLRDADRRCLVFEDVDRYDRRSVEIVQRVFVEARGSRVVATATHGGALSAKVSITLGSLSEAAIAQLGINLRDSDASDGLPLTIEQLQRARVEGARDRSVRARLDALPAGARRVLAALVVAGLRAELSLLAEVAGARALAEDLDVLVGRNLVRLVAEHVEVCSPTQRDRIYQEISEADRRSLHTAWRVRLAAAGAAPVLLAHHAWQSDPAARSLELAEAAASAAERGDDPAARLRWRSRALACADIAADLPARVRNGLALGDALYDLRDLGLAEEAFQEVLVALATPGAAGPSADAQARRGLARVWLLQGQLGPAREQLRLAMERALEGGDRSLIGELALDLSAILQREGKAGDVNKILAEGMRRSVDDPSIRWRLFVAAAERAHAARHDEQTVRLCERALDTVLQLTPDAEVRLASARVRWLLARACMAMGERAQAVKHRAAAIDSLRVVGDRRAVVELLLGGEVFAGEATLEPEPAALDEAAELALSIGWSEGVARARAARQWPEDAVKPASNG